MVNQQPRKICAIHDRKHHKRSRNAAERHFASNIITRSNSKAPKALVAKVGKIFLWIEKLKKILKWILDYYSPILDLFSSILDFYSPILDLYSPADFAGGNLPSADEYEDMTEEQPLEDELQQQPKFAMGPDDLNLEHQIPSNQNPSQIDDNFLLGNSLNENSNPKPKRLTESNRNAAIPLFTGSISFLFAFVFFQFFFLHSIIN